MHDDVRTVLDRSGEDRGAGRAIDCEAGAGAMGGLGGGGNVRYAPGRVRRGLDPDELGLARPNRLPYGLGGGSVHEIHQQAPIGCKALQPSAQPPIHHPRSDHMVAGLEGKEHRSGRRHPGSEEEATGPMLQGRQERFRLGEPRVLRTSIGIAAAILIVGIADKGCGHMNGRDQCLRRFVDPAEGLCDQGSGTNLRHPINSCC